MFYRKLYDTHTYIYNSLPYMFFLINFHFNSAFNMCYFTLLVSFSYISSHPTVGYFWSMIQCTLFLGLASTILVFPSLTLLHARELLSLPFSTP